MAQRTFPRAPLTLALAQPAAPRLLCRQRRKRTPVTKASADVAVTAADTQKAAYVKVELPPLSQDFIPASAGLPSEAFGATRTATALVFPPTNKPKGSSVPAVVFGHGFSQPPLNYESTLRRFTDEGWLVIAPNTSILDIVFQTIETTGFFTKPPAKLQSALILDTLRATQYIKEQIKDYKISDVLLCGHSMGAATSLVAASKLKGYVKGVGVMAPAVKQTLETKVNPDLHLDGRPQSTTEGINFFRSSYPSPAPLHILGGREDLIVQQPEVTGLHTVAAEGLPGDLSLYWLNGSHIGFEDKVDVEVEAGGIIGWFQNLLFKVINFLLYELELTAPITGDFSEQRESAQALLVAAFTAALAGAGTDGVIDRVVKDVNATRVQEASPKAQQALADNVAAKPEEAPWVLQTGLLLSYSAAHATSLAATLYLLQHHGDELSSFSSGGAVVVAGLAAGLVYENLILAAGRFITDSGTKNISLLDALNDPRFLFHSGAPLLCLTGIDLASRAGVTWAGSAWFEGGVALATAAVVALSTVRNTLLLSTKPTWSSGIFHFTYDDKGFDFTRIIPVAATTLLLTVLGGAATLHDHALWPFFLGPAACLALSAGVIPRSVAPMILTGNAGEVLLIASLAWTEYQVLGLIK